MPAGSQPTLYLIQCNDYKENAHGGVHWEFRREKAPTKYS